MIDKIFTPGATPKGLTAPQKRMWGMVASLQAYMKTYDKQPMYLDYQDKTFIDDMLYGLGRALSKDYEFAGGFDKFKAFLRDYLAAETPRSETGEYERGLEMGADMCDRMARSQREWEENSKCETRGAADILDGAAFAIRALKTSRSATAGFAEAITASVMNASPAARLEACAPFNAAPQATGTGAADASEKQEPAAAAPLSQSDKPEGLPFCRVCGSRENEACPYHTLKSGCPHGVPMVSAKGNEPLEHALRMLDNAKMRVGSFGNMNIEVVRRDEAAAIMRDALRQAVIESLVSRSSVAENKWESLCPVDGFNIRWISPGGICPVDIPTTGILLREINRLRGEIMKNFSARSARVEPDPFTLELCEELFGCFIIGDVGDTRCAVCEHEVAVTDWVHATHNAGCLVLRAKAYLVKHKPECVP